ncbi:MAG: hypothetical protein ACXAC7_00605 [Candidatus Hodarchaeales archaeon]|jgi:hypothetical protein
MEFSLLENTLQSKNTFKEKILFVATFLRNEEYLNVFYLISTKNETAYARIGAIGAPRQMIDTVQQAIRIPIGEILFPVADTPVLRRVYDEKRRIYFKKLPELFAGLFPDAKVQPKLVDTLHMLGITDVAVIPIFHKDNQPPIAILAVLGPLLPDQLNYLKNVVEILQKSLH